MGGVERGVRGEMGRGASRGTWEGKEGSEGTRHHKGEKVNE